MQKEEIDLSTSRRKMKKIPETLSICALKMAEEIYFKFGMWTPLLGGQLYRKIS